MMRLCDRAKVSVLMVHNRYQVRGGEDESTDAEADLLRRNGHSVRLLEFDNVSIDSFRKKASAACSTAWSPSAFKVISDAASSEKFDVLHCQNIFPLISPSIYYAAHRHGLKVVQAVRNYRLVCASANLFREGTFCDDCVGSRFPTPAVKHRCYRSSAIGSLAIAAMQAGHRAVGTWHNKVDSYVALTDFVRSQLVRGGFPADKITVKPNFVPDLSQLPVSSLSAEPYAIYVGRLTKEKGVDWLTRQWPTTDAPLLVLVGEGDYDSQIEESPAIKTIGRKSLAETYSLIKGAQFLIQPARWPEPFGRTVIEAFALGIPVLAADVGGLSELVKHGVNGLLYQPSDIAGFTDSVKRLSDADFQAHLSRGARKSYEERYNPEMNYHALMNIYHKVLGDRV